jgi:hypothetical protein
MVRTADAATALISEAKMATEQEEWARGLKEIPPKKVDRSTWPKGVRGLSLDEMNGLGIDNDALIYWHGKPIQIRQTVELRRWEFGLALTVAIATMLQGIASMFPFIPAWLSRTLGF